GSMARVYEALARGRAGTFFLDQRLKRGIPVPFFGRPAWASAALAAAHARTKLPVYFINSWREGVARHGARFEGPLPMTGDIERDTAALTAVYERVIRERPHNWFWLHDRWKAGET